MLQSKKSLAFYQMAKPTNSLIDLMDVNSSIFATTMQGEILTSAMYSTNDSLGTINSFLDRIDSYKEQFQTIYSSLNETRTSTEKELSVLLANNPLDNSKRTNGVSHMWNYLEAEAKMGGNSSGFSSEQQKELLEKGKIRNFEGHHINSVGAHPDLQSNPDNVIPLEEHRFDVGPRDHLKAHGYNWRNSTEGQLLDRNQILTDTNNRRVSEKQLEIKTEQNNIIKNELLGIGTAIAIGFGMGFTIGFISILAQNGLSVESVRKASIVGLKTGSTSAIFGGISYGITRSIGEIATGALTNSLFNRGIEITKNITKMCSMASIGLLSILLYSTYQFVKLKQMGYATKDVLIRVGNQALFSLIVLFVSIAAQHIFGKKVGVIVSTSAVLILFSYKYVQSVHMKKIMGKIQVYTIRKYCPSY